MQELEVEELSTRLNKIPAEIRTAVSHFGSGWGWLSLDKKGKLIIHSTPNQDSPILEGLTPLIGIDVWEHAYYLKYQNRRVEYVENWRNLVNWEKIEENYKQKSR